MEAASGRQRRVARRVLFRDSSAETRVRGRIRSGEDTDEEQTHAQAQTREQPEAQVRRPGLRPRPPPRPKPKPRLPLIRRLATLKRVPKIAPLPTQYTKKVVRACSTSSGLEQQKTSRPQTPPPPQSSPLNLSTVQPATPPSPPSAPKKRRRKQWHPKKKQRKVGEETPETEAPKVSEESEEIFGKIEFFGIAARENMRKNKVFVGEKFPKAPIRPGSAKWCINF